MKSISVAIDGPAGAGKSTIAKCTAEKLGITYVDTGAMYRAVTLSMIRNNVDIGDLNGIENILSSIDIKLNDGRLFLDGEDVSSEIREPEVNRLVSPVSAVPIIRKKMVELQRKMAQNTSIIMDGRDIGTNVLKNADVKIFLTASLDERAQRRYTELIKKGLNVNLESIKADIKKRDDADSSRTIDPLKKAEDAYVVDTTALSIDQAVEKVLSIIKEKCEDAV